MTDHNQVLKEFRDIKSELRSINKEIVNTSKKVHHAIISHLNGSKETEKKKGKEEEVEEEKPIKTKTRKRKAENIEDQECSGLVFMDPPEPCPKKNEEQKMERMIWDHHKITVCHSCKLAKGRWAKKQKTKETITNKDE